MDELLSRLWSWLSDIQKAAKGKPHEIQLAFKRPMLTIVEEYHINSWRTLAFGIIWNRDCYILLLHSTDILKICWDVIGMWWCVSGLWWFRLSWHEKLQLVRAGHSPPRERSRPSTGKNAKGTFSLQDLLYTWYAVHILGDYWMILNVYTAFAIFWKDYALAVRTLAIQVTGKLAFGCVWKNQWKTWPVASKSKTFPLV